VLKKCFDKTLLRFLLVGAANTLVGSGVMFLAYNLFRCSYWLSSALNYIVGSVLSYFLNKYFTFRNQEKSLGQILRFILNIAVCYGLAYGVAKPIARAVLAGFSTSLQENGAMLVGMGLFVVLNYVGQRLLVFKKKD